jgi:IS1 family transposase
MTKRKQVISALVEGNSIRATCRMTDVAKGTVLKLLADVGNACIEYQDVHLKGLSCKRIECDEIWAYCYAKDRNVPEKYAGKMGFGSIWTWTAICADTKLFVTWAIGGRGPDEADLFMKDLASRLSSRVQLSTDGHKVYLNAVDDAFGENIDYGMLVKIYSAPPTGNETRYSPGECCGAKKKKIKGNPDMSLVSTSFAERNNLTMRMHNRRFTRLTNGFSKKLENLSYSIGLHTMYYNFARIHQSLRVTPAMEAGLTDHVWDLEEIVSLMP